MSQNSNPPPRLLHDGFWEHGRFYGSWRPRKYLCPIDAEELNRLDIFHKFFLVARNNVLYSSPVPSDRALKVLDLGTGTGIWSINVAEEENHEPEILAVDLNQIQPALIPRGVTTMQFDIEEPAWEPLGAQFDLIHIRMLFGSIQTDKWPEIYQKSLSKLRPGSGYIEHLEIDWTAQWEGDDVPAQSALKDWSNLLLRAHDQFNRSARVDSTQVRQNMERAGLVDFREEKIRCYVNPWSSDRYEREVARWFNLGLSQALEAMSLMPMIEKLGMTKEQVQELCGHVKNEICVLRYHAYCTLHVWTARSPSN